MSARKPLWSISEATSVVRLARCLRSAALPSSLTGADPPRKLSSRAVLTAVSRILASSDWARPIRVSSAVSRAAGNAPLVHLPAEDPVRDLSRSRRPILELVGQPVDDRIEQADQHGQRVAGELGLAPDMVGEGDAAAWASRSAP